MLLIEPSDARSEEAVEEEAVEEAVEEEVAEEAVEEEVAEHNHQFHRKPSNQYRTPQTYKPWESSQQTSMETEPKEKTSLKSAKGTFCSTKMCQASTPPRRKSNLS